MRALLCLVVHALLLKLCPRRTACTHQGHCECASFLRLFKATASDTGKHMPTLHSVHLSRPLRLAQGSTCLHRTACACQEPLHWHMRLPTSHRMHLPGPLPVPASCGSPLSSCRMPCPPKLPPDSVTALPPMPPSSSSVPATCPAPLMPPAGLPAGLRPRRRPSQSPPLCTAAAAPCMMPCV
eukprot:scaffold61094_cov19-Tisochrysis_lutea.AAC.2